MDRAIRRGDDCLERQAWALDSHRYGAVYQRQVLPRSSAQPISSLESVINEVRARPRGERSSGPKYSMEVTIRIDV